MPFKIPLISKSKIQSTSTTAPGAGEPGQKIQGTMGSDASFTSEAYTDLGYTIALSGPGSYLITIRAMGLLKLASLSGGQRIRQRICIAKQDNTEVANHNINSVETGQSPLWRLTPFSLTFFYTAAAAETLKVRGILDKWSGTESYSITESIVYTAGASQSEFFAVRL